MPEILVQVRDVRKSFADDGARVDVLKGVSFDMARGELIALLGVSGSGKTTLLQILGGLDMPTSGSVEIGGRNLSALSRAELAGFRSRSIGFVFQFHHLLPDFTALENAYLPGLIAGTPRRECAQRARELLDSVGLSHRLTHYPSELSGGERQRVALARALFNKPSLVLADEPTGNLDSANGDQLLDMIHRLNHEYGQAFLVATHNDRLATGMHRTVVLRDGSVSP